MSTSCVKLDNGGMGAGYDWTWLAEEMLGPVDEDPACEDCGLSVEGIRCSCGRGGSSQMRKLRVS